MRELKATLGGTSLSLTANWRASLDIAEQVGDPLMIAREAAIENTFVEKGLFYRPSFLLTTENVAQIILIGVNAGGADMTLDQVGELVFDAGLIDAKEVATDYLALIIGPKSKEVKGGKGEGKKQRGQK